MFDDKKVDNFAFNEANMKMGYSTNDMFTFSFGSFDMEDYFTVSNPSEYDITLFHDLGREGTTKVLETDLVNMAIIAAYVRNQSVRGFKNNYKEFNTEKVMQELINSRLVTIDRTMPNKFFIRQNGNLYDIGFSNSKKEEIVFYSQIHMDKAVELLRAYTENFQDFMNVFNSLVLRGLLTEKEKLNMLSIYMCGSCPKMLFMSKKEKDEVPHR